MMTDTLKNTLLIFCLLVMSINSSAQEEAPLKTFHYSISLNHLKTEAQATIVKERVSNLEGVIDCSLILINYELTFSCTNHDMTKFNLMERIKEIILKEGVEIVLINRTIENE